MKIRSKEELTDILDQDLAWRKKELSTLISEVRIAPSKKSPTALRSAVLLLYAHWEGFVKLAAESYLRYVKSKKLKLSELDNCFLALALRKRLIEFESSNKSTIHTQLVDYLFSSLDDRSRFDDEDTITTNSNLNFSTLRELLTTIGIDCSSFELKENLIDAQLLNYRNNIAHGQELMVSRSEYEILHKEMFGMIVEINNRIQNAAVTQAFKKVANR